MDCKPVDILIVDDSDDDILMLEDALTEARLINAVQVVHDGEEALAYLRRQGEFRDAEPPGLVLLDIRMPNKDGLQTLEEIKADPELCHYPVVILTVSAREEDVIRSYSRGACTYIRKPIGFEELRNVIRQFSRYWALVASLPALRERSQA